MKQLKPIEDRDPYAKAVMDAFDCMEAETHQRQCEKCDRQLPIDASRNVYQCPWGSGCNDFAFDKSCYCDCKDSTIRWVDENNPHVAINGLGWFCVCCLQKFAPVEPTPEQGPERDAMFVTRSMAMDAGMPEIEGMRI